MKVAIIGYGKMGKEIETILLERHHQVVLKIDKNNIEEFTLPNLQKADIAIEFSTPNSAVDNYLKCFEAKIPVVSGTTGWLGKIDYVKEQITASDASLFYAPNFSIGVNLFFNLNKKMTEVFNQFEQYEVEIEEIHHTEKLDSPSGTAIHTAEILLENLENKSSWSENNKTKNSQLLITTKREKNVSGTHIVKYESDEDSIEIRHTAFSRKGFAKGAVLAAEWLVGKNGFFTMNDMLKL